MLLVYNFISVCGIRLPACLSRCCYSSSLPSHLQFSTSSSLLVVVARLQFHRRLWYNWYSSRMRVRSPSPSLHFLCRHDSSSLTSPSTQVCARARARAERTSSISVVCCYVPHPRCLLPRTSSPVLVASHFFSAACCYENFSTHLISVYIAAAVSIRFHQELSIVVAVVTSSVTHPHHVIVVTTSSSLRPRRFIVRLRCHEAYAERLD